MANSICNEVRVGCVGRTVANEKFIILDIVSTRGVKIKFLDEFGAEFIRRKENVEKGTIKNPYAITTWGVGRIGICKHTHKERTFWRRLVKKYAEGELPHFNKRWLVLEYWLEDTRKVRDYDIFLTRKGYTLFDPFGRYDNINHIKVSEKSTWTNGIVVVDLFDKTYEVYTCKEECAWETGYCRSRVFAFCHEQAERDGYKFYWASDYANLFFD